MVWESILLMFGITLGTFQIISSWAGLQGISLFRHRIIGYIFGAVLVIGTFTWFFIAVDVGEGGPKGQHDDQAVSVILGGGSALLCTLILPSIAQLRSSGQRQEYDGNLEGLEIFKQMTILQALRRRSRSHGMGN